MTNYRATKSHRPHQDKTRPAPADMDGLEFDARRAARVTTIDTFKAGRTPLTVIHVADHATSVAERFTERAKALRPPGPLACQEGCDWCCYLRVGTAAPEVFRIVEYLRQRLTPEELQTVRQRIVELDEERNKLKPNKRREARLACALLIGHRCSVYPVRPLTCRGFNSSDAHRCELFLESGNKVEVPSYAPQLRLTTFVLDGVRAGLSESGLKGDLLELTAALRIAFETPDARERWLAGDAVFAPARLD